MKKVMMMMVGIGMIMGLVGCGSESNKSEVNKADLEKIAVENVKKMPAPEDCAWSAEKCEVNGDKATCLVVGKNKDGNVEVKKNVNLTKMGEKWSVTGMRTVE